MQPRRRADDGGGGGGGGGRASSEVGGEELGGRVCRGRGWGRGAVGGGAGPAGGQCDARRDSARLIWLVKAAGVYAEIGDWAEVFGDFLLEFGSQVLGGGGAGGGAEGGAGGLGLERVLCQGGDSGGQGLLDNLAGLEVFFEENELGVSFLEHESCDEEGEMEFGVLGEAGRVTLHLGLQCIGCNSLLIA